jgi:hypothetical protein
MSTAQDFWKVFVHLKRPSTLPTVSDYHFFKEGIRPVWEDDENKRWQMDNEIEERRVGSVLGRLTYGHDWRPVR